MVTTKGYSLSEPLAARLRVISVLWISLAILLAALPSQADQRADVITARAAIVEQIEAFQRDDGPAAYAFASPQVRSIFPNPDIFMQMVRSGYPAVYRPSSYTFEDAKWQDDGRMMQPLRIEWKGGEPLIAVYLMARQPDGSWKIDGVFLAKDDRVSA